MPKDAVAPVEIRSDEILTVKLFCEKYPAFPPGGVRWQIFNQDTNGFGEAGAFIKLGRRNLINVPKYFARVRRGGSK